ncbi:flagellar motor stator protein MotA [Parathalassolituus penaei]|uniref:Flagellar motor stator protein MotA n=1 Tax=Parathalassolituus penaei TaxID=2997323 RepID=A0A9X3ISN7_9GAMM|nr:flagellar motor stator protein MotA [Parathalassolituus penaei]MCY0964358.1 flagellar motor stator protein MotA [Parathalassolituus penaei]
MLFLIGMLIVFGSVLYGFVMSHGQLLALWQPFEVLIIVGAALGSFLVSNPWSLVRRTFALLPRVIVGSGKREHAMQMDLLNLIFDILNKARREGMMAIEAEVDSPQSSAIFARYPDIQRNRELANFVADYFRIIVVGNLSAFELEGLMDQEIDTRLHELEQPGTAVTRVADALPGFGIVAAVLGIVITMGAIGGEVTAIGAHVAAALVGTFSGVLLAYGLVGPIGNNMKHLADHEIRLYEAAKAAIIASLHGVPPQLAVEFGRKALYTHCRPGFDELDARLRGR